MTSAPNQDSVQKHVLEYCRPNDYKAWLALFQSLVLQLMAVALIHYNMPILGWTLHSLVTVRLFVQFHDMAHFSYFSSMTINRYFGKLLGIYVHFPFNSWRTGHNHHHKHFGNLDRLDLSQTILFTKKQYENMSKPVKILVRIMREPIVFFLVTAPFVWFVGLFYVIIRKEGILSTSFLEKIMSVVIFTWICPLFGISALGMWIAVYMTNIMGTMLFHLQHSVNQPYRQRKQKWNFAKAAIEGSTYLPMPQPLKTFTNGIEYHHIHHLNTNVASYAIEDCHLDFQKKGSNCQQNQWKLAGINKIDFLLAIKSFFNVMLDEDTQRLEPFSYSG